MPREATAGEKMERSSETFGRNIREIRIRKGMSMQKLADRSGIRLNVISDYEAGIRSNPTLATITKLAEGLGVKASRLLSEHS